MLAPVPVPALGLEVQQQLQVEVAEVVMWEEAWAVTVVDRSAKALVHPESQA